MPLILNGSTGISGTDGSAGTPAVQGTDTNTGMFFPAADTIAFSEGGTEVLRLNSSAQVVYTAGSASLPSITATGDTNTGVYFPGADRLGIATGGTQRAEFDASGNFQFNSGYGSVATAFGCRAWANFNGTGTVAIRASGNVSSVTDLGGNGAYTINFTNAMPDANFSSQVSIGPLTSGFNVGVAERHIISTPTSSSVTVYTADVSTGLVDSPLICVAIFR